MSQIQKQLNGYIFSLAREVTTTFNPINKLCLDFYSFILKTKHLYQKLRP